MTVFAEMIRNATAKYVRHHLYLHEKTRSATDEIQNKSSKRFEDFKKVYYDKKYVPKTETEKIIENMNGGLANQGKNVEISGSKKLRVSEFVGKPTTSGKDISKTLTLVKNARAMKPYDGNRTNRTFRGGDESENDDGNGEDDQSYVGRKNHSLLRSNGKRIGREELDEDDEDLNER
jgi:hypothetical protein